MKKPVSKLSFTKAAMAALAMSAPVMVLAQDGTLTGTVVDDQGEPLIGAVVQVVGTSKAVTTDIDGHFTISAPAGKTLKVSYVGYDPASMKISAGKTV